MQLSLLRVPTEHIVSKNARMRVTELKAPLYLFTVF